MCMQGLTGGNDKQIAEDFFLKESSVRQSQVGWLVGMCRWVLTEDCVCCHRWLSTGWRRMLLHC